MLFRSTEFDIIQSGDHMTSNSSPRVVVAMSGGVDSSVATALLVEQGFDVIGIMLRLWSEPEMETFNRCCTPNAMALARRVAAYLEIPFYVVDVRSVFYGEVVEYFVNGYTQGITPNPCMKCNRHIRFGVLLQQALALDAQYLATGHYARISQDGRGTFQLLRAVDRNKDQSYVLSVLNQEQLSHAMFPVGDYPKREIRQLARKFNLPVADRVDSQDLCFLAGDDYRNFLLRNVPKVRNPGPIMTQEGEVIGQHNGLAFYTIGQRKGLGISAPYPLYVLEKDSSKNALIVGQKGELGKKELFASDVNWIAGEPPTSPIHSTCPGSFRAEIKIRYQAQESWGTITPLDKDQIHIEFDHPLRDITPGQAAVFYDGELVLGNGQITNHLPIYDTFLSV